MKCCAEMKQDPKLSTEEGKGGPGVAKTELQKQPWARRCRQTEGEISSCILVNASN